ncbi:acetate/propionate family kinase [Pelotomaculum propionicicum]|uniref:Acetate kinase n=1 Tax=Pelotomaculum propionicicum TaxID=258475 RepID=A0A4Y7RW30_9FIRM|nr:acetate kinase [Pelotomaculum propionicicum]TEB12970.1 Acetate kinase [Pelotomaculum propionicicum]
MKVLVLNCGSSSVKYKLYDTDANIVLAEGLAERIGMQGSRIKHLGLGENIKISIEYALSGHEEAIKTVLHLFTHDNYGVIKNIDEIQAVGHRILHGGERFSSPVAIDNEVLDLLIQCVELAPLHMQHNIAGIKICQKLINHATQVAVFDTEFHQTMPDYAYIYPIPYDYYKKYKVRKYGFHGISHKYVAQRVAEILCDKSKVEDLKIISCHLGNGASLCAIKSGKSIDTTMGLTPLAGLMMGTRSGDIDPAVIPFLAEKERISLEEVVKVLNEKSGVLGIFGASSDFRDVIKDAGAGNDRARLALDMFIYRVAKSIGSLIPVMGGLDILVFTAGIGENSSEIRRRICEKFVNIGIEIDEQLNLENGAEIEISTVNSTVKVLVIPTDEEKMIAQETISVAKCCSSHKMIS